MPLILLILGFILIIYNYRAIKKQDDIKDKSFGNILKNNKDGMNDYKIEIGLLRRDLAESLTELQEEILEIKTKLKYSKEYEEISESENILEDEEMPENEGISEYRNIPEYREISENEFLINSQDEDGVISEISFSQKAYRADSNKTESIKNLLEEGLSDEEICYELSVSKGEVLLVKGLFKK